MKLKEHSMEINICRSVLYKKKVNGSNVKLSRSTERSEVLSKLVEKPIFFNYSNNISVIKQFKSAIRY